MRHFRLIRENAELAPLRAELAAHDELWAAQQGRQLTAPAQRETNAIPIRGLRRSRIRGRRRRDVHESRYTSMSAAFPATVGFLEAFAAEQEGSLGRARYARLLPGKTVLPHMDRGAYYRDRDRYHLVVRSAGGSLLRAGGETVRMREGELWWFDNKAVHDARNDSSADRIHLIFDLLPTRLRPSPVAEDPEILFDREMAVRERSAAEEVARAARLYIDARERPGRWASLLAEAGLDGLAAKRPLDALARLLWPGLGSVARSRCASGIGWCLGLLDIGRAEPGRLEEAIMAAGGLDAVHARWRDDRDAALYGFRWPEEEPGAAAAVDSVAG